MPKQQETLLQQLIEFITEFDSNPFQDFYIMLVFRFIIYVYVFILLVDIVMGHQKPNIKTRVLRKFQIVYGGDILKQLDNHDIQQLQVTISNTILNATKELKPKSHHKEANDSMIKQSGLESERRSLRVEESSELSGSSLSRKSSKLRFDLQRNQYYEPRKIVKDELINEQIPVIQEVKDLQIESNLAIDSQQVEGQNQQQKLSPTSQQHQNFAKINKPYFQHFQQQQYQQSTDNFTRHHVDTEQQLEKANTKYPQEQINAMDLEIQQKQAKQLQDILHLSDDMLNDSLKESNQIYNDQFPSVFKAQSTGITSNNEHEIDI